MIPNEESEANFACMIVAGLLKAGEITHEYTMTQLITHLQSGPLPTIVGGVKCSSSELKQLRQGNNRVAKYLSDAKFQDVQLSNLDNVLFRISMDRDL